MTAAWWNKMKEWEKMVLVLAIAMVAVITLGLARLALDRHRLRKYKKLQDRQRLDPEHGQRMVETKDEIPFGIRALEAGIEVEGIVISRPCSRPGTPVKSVVNEESSSTLVANGSDTSSIKAPPPSPIPHSGSRMGLVSFQSQDGDDERTSPVANFHGFNKERKANKIDTSNTRLSVPPPAKLSPTIPASSSARSNYVSHARSLSSDGLNLDNPTSQLARPSKPWNNRHTYDYVSIPTRLSSPARNYGSQPPLTGRPPSSPSVSPQTSSRSESPEETSSSNASPEMMSTHTAELVDIGLRLPKSALYADSPEFLPQRNDLDSLNAHRISHAAEVGQLVRRSRFQTRGSTSPSNNITSLETEKGVSKPMVQVTTTEINVPTITEQAATAEASPVEAPTSFSSHHNNEPPTEVVSPVRLVHFEEKEGDELEPTKRLLTVDPGPAFDFGSFDTIQAPTQVHQPEFSGDVNQLIAVALSRTSIAPETAVTKLSPTHLPPKAAPVRVYGPAENLMGESSDIESPRPSNRKKLQKRPRKTSVSSKQSAFSFVPSVRGSLARTSSMRSHTSF